MKNKVFCLILLGGAFFSRTIDAQDVYELDLVGGTYGVVPRENPSKLYREGRNLQGNKEVLTQDAINKFKKAVDPINIATNFDEYQSKIKAGEYIVKYYITQNDMPRAAKYSDFVLRYYDELLNLVRMQMAHNRSLKPTAQKVAQILLNILDGKSYKNLDGKDRFVALSSSGLARYGTNKDTYIAFLAASGDQDAQKTQSASIQNEALSLSTLGMTELNKYESLKGDERKEAAQKAFDLLMRAHTIDSTIFNVEVNLARMLSNNEITPDLTLAKEYANNALALAKNAQNADTTKIAEDLKNYIDAEIFAQDAFEKLEKSKDKSTTPTQREQLEKEAFGLLRQAADLSAKNFNILYALAEMYHDAIGTTYDPAKANGTLLLATNLAVTRDEKTAVAELKREIDERNEKVDKEIRSADDTDKKRASSRIFGTNSAEAAARRTEIMKQLIAKELDKSKSPAQKSWMNRLFGSAKARSGSLDGSDASTASSASASSSNSSARRKPKSPFGFDL